jgi:hypothetical protein
MMNTRMKNSGVRVVELLCVFLLPLVCQAGEMVWTEEDMPNIFVRWWINTKYQMGAGFPVFICMLAILGLGILVFIVNLVRHRARMKTIREKKETLTNA